MLVEKKRVKSDGKNGAEKINVVDIENGGGRGTGVYTFFKNFFPFHT